MNKEIDWCRISAPVIYLDNKVEAGYNMFANAKYELHQVYFLYFCIRLIFLQNQPHIGIVIC